MIHLQHCFAHKHVHFDILTQYHTDHINKDVCDWVSSIKYNGKQVIYNVYVRYITPDAWTSLNQITVYFKDKVKLYICVQL